MLRPKTLICNFLTILTIIFLFPLMRYEVLIKGVIIWQTFSLVVVVVVLSLVVAVHFDV